jgi:hypothetical protein
MAAATAHMLLLLLLLHTKDSQWGIASLAL